MTASVTDQPTEGMQLDSRQRAMLQAMGITLWEPEFYEVKQAVAQENNAQTAINKIALQSSVAAASHEAVTEAAHAERAAPASAPSTSAPVMAPRAAPPKPAATPSAAVIARQPLPEGIAQMDWLQLQTAISGCRACGLCESRNNTVFGVGQASTEPMLAPRADWLIVGEAPGENEDIQGEPFVGQAGKLLDNMLRAMVIDGKPLGRHSNVFIANVLKCRPPANRNPSPAEVAQCQPYLLRQIELLQPKIIVAMGRFAVQSLLGSTEPLGKLRGRVHHMPAVSAPVIVTYHPAYLLRNLPDKAKAWADLMLAMETLQALPPTA